MYNERNYIKEVFMFSGNQYWWAGLLIMILFIGLNLGVFFLRKRPDISYAIAYTIACYLLIYKTIEYIYWQAIGLHIKIPVEFSAMSYFLFGIFITFKIKKFDQFPVFAAILAGTMYSVTFWIAPDSHVAGGESPFLSAMAVVNHHLLYFAGMLMLANVRKFSYKNAWQHVLCTGVLVGYSWLIYSLTSYAEQVGKPILIEITDGSILNYLATNGSIPTWILPIYYIACVILFGALVCGFYSLNNICAKRRIALSLPEDYFPATLTDTYKLAQN